MTNIVQQYQQFTQHTATYPYEQRDPQVVALLYLSSGLAGEAGEVSNVIKKLHRDGSGPELKAKVIKELGDVMWYAARIADELNVPLEEVLIYNMKKLSDRMERGTIHGSGDDR